MPPPLPAQQGSRAGLITTLVVFLILFLVSSVFWFSESSKRNKAEQERDAARKTLTQVGDPTAPEVAKLIDAGKGGGTPAIDMAVQQRDNVTRTFTGMAGDPEGAMALAKNTITQALAALPKQSGPGGQPAVPLDPNQPVTNAVRQLADAYARLDAQRTALQGQLTAAQTAAQAAAQGHQAALQQKDQETAAARAEAAAARAEVDAMRQQQGDQITTITTDTSNQIKALTDAVAAAQSQLAAREADNKKQQDEINLLRSIVKKYRMDPKENQVRQADGAITRIPGNGYCYIDRGVGQGITVGMTFEVYDRVKGVPPLGEGMSTPEDAGASGARATGPLGMAVAGARTSGYETELPKGKGSIEVVSVGPGTSLCRIVKVEQGEILREGDVIANLVYDPKTKYTFFVYGDYDLDNNGSTSTQDKSVILRLIQQWGGKVAAIKDPTKPADSLPLNTDFVVMGVEPEVPTLSEDEANNPEAVARRQAAEERLAAYNAVRNRAIELGIPIMNQNRFLYFVGYFDQARR